MAISHNYSICIVNHISCSGVEVTSSRLYSPASSNDYKEAVNYIH